MKTYNILFLSLVFITLWGCTTILDEPRTTIDVSPSDEINNPEVISFDFATTKERIIEITILDNGDSPLQGVMLSYGYLFEDQYHEIGKGLTNEHGRLEVILNLATAINELVVQTDYLGLPDQTIFDLNSYSNAFILGGKKTNNSAATSNTSNRFLDAAFAQNGFYFDSNYDDNGVPFNLLPVNDYIPQDILDLINASLPERQPVPTYNPQYLEHDLNTDTWLSDSAEVWVTFVHEGAGWTNTLGYYTYDLEDPPSSREDIDSLFIIFPNVSFDGSGGGLVSGNKIKLGDFSANTGIGWFLLPGGWRSGAVAERNGIKFSNKRFNTMTDEVYSQHTILLKDNAREIILLGFEDTTRPGGDNDFNDAVFYISASPYQAIITNQLEDTKTNGLMDSDGDGVSDQNDDYPLDAEKAFNIFYPAKDVFGTLAFEDQWPFKGDYDMNDLVVDYNYHFVTNTANKTVSLSPSFRFRAAGANYKNGFAVNFPFAQELIKSISGDVYQGAIPLRTNFTEADNVDNTIIITDDAHALLGGEGPINTLEGGTTLPIKNIDLTISFGQPIAMNALGYAPFNPFIFVNGDRSHEVHLADHAPTAKADMSHFNTGHDLSVANQGYYYKSYQFLPWAINVPITFDYPKEYQPINEAYLNTVKWAASNGQEFKDWYTDKSGYRNNTLIKK